MFLTSKSKNAWTWHKHDNNFGIKYDSRKNITEKPTE